MKKLLLLIVLILGCSKDDPLRLEQYGYVDFNGSIDLNVLSKSDVPLCSNKTPVTINFMLANQVGLTFIRNSDIALSGNNITLLDSITLPVDNYTMDDISLLSNDGTVTHRTPNSDTDLYDFTPFVDRPTPFALEILPETVTDVSADLMCYTSEILDLFGSIDGSLKIVDLQTLYYQLPEGNCMDRFTVDTDGKRIIDISVTGRGIRGTPIIKDFTLMEVSAWNGNTLLNDPVEYSVYNPDGNITFADVVQFGVDCD